MQKHERLDDVIRIGIVDDQSRRRNSISDDDDRDDDGRFHRRKYVGDSQTVAPVHAPGTGADDDNGDDEDDNDKK